MNRPCDPDYRFTTAVNSYLLKSPLAEWASSLSDAGSFRSLSIKAVLLLYTFIPSQSIYTFSGFLPEQDAADGVHDLFGNETVDDQENKVDPDHAGDLDFFADDLKDLDQDTVIEVEGVAVVRNESDHPVLRQSPADGVFPGGQGQDQDEEGCDGHHFS